MATADDTFKQDLRIELNFETGKWKAQTKSVSKDLDKLNTRFKTTSETVGRASKNTDQFAKALRLVVASGAVGYMTKTALELDRVTNRMKFATESSEDFAQAMKLSADTANELGLALVPTQRGLATLQASAKGTSLAGREIEELFKGISSASGALSLTADETNSVFLAFSQIISKGKVQAEELRSQIGERIPGALKLAERALGVTGAELDKLLQSGSLTADDLLPKLAKEFQKTFGEQAQKNAESLTARLNKVSNGLKIIAKSAVEAFDNVAPLLSALASISDKYNGLRADEASSGASFSSALGKIREESEKINKEFASGNIDLEEREKRISKLIKLAKLQGRSGFGSLGYEDLFGLGDGDQEFKEIRQTNKLLADLTYERGRSAKSIEIETGALNKNLKALEEGKKRREEIKKQREQERREYKEQLDLDLGVKKAEQLKKQLELYLKLKDAQTEAIKEANRQKENDPNSLKNLKKRRQLLLENLRISKQSQSIKDANEVSFIERAIAGSSKDIRLNIEAKTRELGATRGDVEVAKQQLATQERMERQLEELNKKIEKVKG
jgi:tape measure domain-containing protein